MHFAITALENPAMNGHYILLWYCSVLFLVFVSATAPYIRRDFYPQSKVLTAVRVCSLNGSNN